jgi:tRNA 2-thiouridine synthesizing protein C
MLFRDRMDVFTVTASFFLFCGEISSERLRWIRECIPASGADDPGHRQGCTLFLTGDALMSLIDARIKQEWFSLSSDPRVKVFADGDELRLHGLRDEVHSRFPGVNVTGNSINAEETTFWQSIVTEIQEKWIMTGKAAFLLCYSPYMSRTPVYMLRFLKSAVEAGLTPELYSYLDGVHAAHMDQRPSEFENIGEGIVALSTVAGGSGEDPWFGACSRCATARGYYVKNPETGGCEPVSCIDAVTIRPLKEILDRFTGDHPILAHTCGCAPGSGVAERQGAKNPPPILSIMITNTPYVSEWTFGGLSLAVAAAMGGIETRVIFIEQGVYSLCGNHEVTPEDRVFNVQEMLEATSDIPDLHYYVYTPSLRERGLKVAECQSFVETVDGPGLGTLLGVRTHANNGRQIRTIFF